MNVPAQIPTCGLSKKPVKNSAVAPAANKTLKNWKIFLNLFMQISIFLHQVSDENNESMEFVNFSKRITEKGTRSPTVLAELPTPFRE